MYCSEILQKQRMLGSNLMVVKITISLWYKDIAFNLQHMGMNIKSMI